MQNDIKKILRELDMQKNQKEKEAEDRKEYLYSKVPELEEIEVEIRSVGLKAARAALNPQIDSGIIKQQLKDKLEELTDRRNTIYKKLNIPDDYLEPDYNCKTCKDTGFIKNTGEKCICLKQKIISSSYKNSNMELLLKDQNFDNFNIELYEDEDQENMYKILENVKKFKDNFKDKKEYSLIFTGPPGTGKTFLSSCIAKDILDLGYTVVYRKISDIKDIAEDIYFRKNTSREMEYENIYTADLLIIDDLGTELTNKLVITELFKIIDNRLHNGKKTIISTNLNIKDLSERYGERILSRLFGEFLYLEVKGKDLRIFK